MIPTELMAAKVKEAVAARRRPEFLIIGRTNAMRASTLDDALRRGLPPGRRRSVDTAVGGLCHVEEDLRGARRRLRRARSPKTDWTAVEHEVLQVIGIGTLLAVERATVEQGKA